MSKRSDFVKLFTVGPVEMYPQTLEVASKQLPYFRNEEFSKVMKENEERLKRLLGLASGCVAMMSGSGTCAMEAVVHCCLQPQNRVLIINGGSFGKRFTQLCDIYHIPYDEIHLSFQETLTSDKLNAFGKQSYCALLVNIHETSTGQLYNLDMLSAFTKKHNMYLIVDAISSFLADPYHMDMHGIDCTILSSQKALALSPGISMIAMQQRFYKEMVEPKDTKVMYLNINEHIHNMKRGQTPFTPAVGIFIELQQRLAMIERQGLLEVQNEIAQRATYFRRKIASLGLQVPRIPLSNALTPILLKGNASYIYEYLKETYGLVLTPSGGEQKNTWLRVGHLGNLALSDYDELCLRIKECL